MSTLIIFSLLKIFPHGFIGILFKEICDNEKSEFYSFGKHIITFYIPMAYLFLSTTSIRNDMLNFYKSKVVFQRIQNISSIQKNFGSMTGNN